MVFIIAFAAIILVAALAMLNNSKENIKKIELDESKPSKIHFSDDFSEEEPPKTIIEKEHTISLIYKGKDINFLWVCPTCETENTSSSNMCCLCHHKR